MTKFTKKQLKNLVADGVAVDLTYYSADMLEDLSRGKDFRQIGFAADTYGCAGSLYMNMETRELYAVCERSRALYFRL